MKEIEQVLLDKIGTGEVVKVKYNGGSQPGSVREIVPLIISNGKLRAECLTSNATKTFDISKISFPNTTNQQSETEWNLNPPKLHNFNNLIDFYNSITQDIKSLGWHINYEDDIISLHRYSSKGIPLKGSDISLEYHKYSYDLMVDHNTDDEVLTPYAGNIRDRKKPYTIRAPQTSTRIFADLNKAILFFMEQAQISSPLGERK